MELEEFVELARGKELTESEKTLVSGLKILADTHKFDIVVVGASHGPIRGVDKSCRQLMKQREIVENYSGRGSMMGKRPDLIVFDDFSVLEDRMMDELTMPGGRGSAKSMAMAEHMYKMAYPPCVGADQVKGPKGPRGKWGKL